MLSPDDERENADAPMPVDGQPAVTPDLLHPAYRLAGVEIVGTLAESVAGLIALSPDARTVRIHPSTAEHIRVQRSRQDADFAFANLGTAILRPHMIGTEDADYRRIRLVHRVEGAPRWLHVALKLVLAIDAKSGRDEIWVCTAYAMGRSVAQLRNKPTVWHVTDL
jgi:hypothetical protein